ncbi:MULTISPECIES: carbohydrate kinase family protein [Prochlorococcus]|uniref:Ribokinase n=1 Tax=Prochlorococcus marinus str. MIT 9116 TaxID=167544 RepID=A0A0A1ZRE2_PROMR|nr:PfkB family carbohydrate kinase [Prochlorococcus marinus]KGF90655.1 Ribokinase [Prochlorococcus marinus str. MIT 9107]KGF90758.1 Ribokinase [Prochlorococcus marinus str. MIT 9116]KGF93680.1 Ribokinase [Prochlorococcus marinus str. MIT 9123]
MAVEKNNRFEEDKFKKGNLNFAVIGHVEWMNFLNVDKLPKPGVISHSKKSLEYPAGGGSIIAKTLSELTLNQIHFFTALGKDDYGDKCFKILSNMGINLHVAWRDKPTRKGFSLIDLQGERAITVIGERLAPNSNDNLEWSVLKNMDGIFITASDSEIFKMARSASILCTTPRVGLNTINKSNVLLDGLIGSNLDPGECFSLSELAVKPKYIIKTEGENGGIIFPGGRYKALKNNKTKVDSYGCGDSFAAAILYGMTSKWNIDKSLNLAKIIGRNTSQFFGPYAQNYE